MRGIYQRGDVSSRYVPKGSRKVADRQSDAVVYLYEYDGQKGRRYSAVAYCGKRAKPDAHYYYRSEKDRERFVAEFFDGRRRSLALKSEQRGKNSKPRALQIGNILKTSWGYDQTNIEFFQVTGLIGSTMVELRELAQSSKSTGWCREDVAPVPDEFVGEPIRRKVSGYDGTSCRIDDVRYAFLHGTGVAHATSYA